MNQINWSQSIKNISILCCLKLGKTGIAHYSFWNTLTSIYIFAVIAWQRQKPEVKFKYI